MATTDHTTTSPATAGRRRRPTIARRTSRRRPPSGDTGPHAGATADDATAGAASTFLLTLGVFTWPFVVVVGALVIVVPFLAGLLLLVLAGAVLLLPYRLLRRWRSRR